MLMMGHATFRQMPTQNAGQDDTFLPLYFIPAQVMSHASQHHADEEVADAGAR